MLYSHSVNDNKISLFGLFLNKVINGDSKYKPVVDKILGDVHGFTTGAKTLYQIDRDKISIVVYLSSSHREYFSTLDVENIDTADYQQVLTYLKG